MKMKDEQRDQEYMELSNKIEEITGQLQNEIQMNKDLQEEIILLQEKNQCLSEDMKNHITEKVEIKNQNEKLKEELEQKLNITQNVHNQQEQEIRKSELQQEIKKLKEEVNLQKEASNGLNTKIEKLRNKKKALNEQILQQEAQIKLQQSQYKQLETDLLQVRMKLSNEIQINELKEKQMDDIKKSLKLEKDEFIRFKQQCKLAQSSEFNEQDLFKQKLEKQIADLQKDNKRLQQEKEKVIKDRIELQRQVAEKEGSMDELQIQMTQSEKIKEDNFQSLKLENFKLNQVLQQAQLEKSKVQEELQKEIKSQQSTQAQIAKILSEKLQLEKDQCLLKEQIANWQRMCKEKEEEKTEFGKKQEELISSLKIIENNFKQTNQSQRERLFKSEEKADKLNAMMTQIEEELNVVKEELAVEIKEKQKLHIEVNRLKQENTRLLEDINLFKQNNDMMEEQLKQQLQEHNELNRAVFQEKNATSSELDQGQPQQQLQILYSPCGESQQQFAFPQDKTSLLNQIKNSIENFLSSTEQENNPNLYAFLKNISHILQNENQQDIFEELEQIKPLHKKSSSIPLQSAKQNDILIEQFQQIISCILDENLGNITSNIKTFEEIFDQIEINQTQSELTEYFKSIKHKLKSFFLSRLELQEENEQLLKLQQKIEIEDQNKNNLNNFVDVNNVSNFSIKSDFSDLFGESNLQQCQLINNQVVEEQIGKGKFEKKQFKQIQLEELNKLQNEKRDLEIANEQLKEFNEQLMIEAKDQEKNELRFQQQKNLLQLEIQALQEKLQAKSSETMSAHEREHIKTNLLKFLNCAYNKQSQEGDEYLKHLFSMVNVNETDQEEFKKTIGIKADKKKGFISLLFKR